MRLALYVVAAVLLAGLGSAFPLSRAQVTTPSRPTERERVVYVDPDRLAKVHPAWQALVEMDSTLAEVEPTSSEVVSRVDLPRQSWGGNYREPRPQTDRRKLQSELKQDAMDSLRRQESDMKQGVWLRIEANRAAMTRRAETELAPRFREIEASAEATTKALDEQYAPQRLNAGLRESIVKAAAKSPAVDAAAAATKVQSASAELARIDEACEADKRRVADGARESIGALRKAEAARIEDLVGDYQRSETSRVENAMAAAQDRLSRDLGSGDPVAIHSGAVSVAGSSPTDGRMRHAGRTARDVGLGSLRASAVAVRKQIESDVIRAVKEMGRQKGVKVTFQPHTPGVSDETELFASLMQQEGWGVSGPVLCMARGR